MELILASHNQKKIRELTRITADAGLDLDVRSLSDIGFTREIVENGSSFEENALIKATAIRRPGAMTAADDSGLCVDALDGAPGIYSARFSGEGATDRKNNAYLLERLDGTENRAARFISVIAFVLPDGRAFTARGECEGVILTASRGENGFGYDPLFYLPSLGKTFAELSPDEKDAVSHRGKAMRAFIKLLKEYAHEC